MILTKPAFALKLHERITIPGTSRVLEVYECFSEASYLNGRNLIDHHQSNSEHSSNREDLISVLKNTALLHPDLLSFLEGKELFLPFETSPGVISTFSFNKEKNSWEIEETWSDNGHPGPLYMVILSQFRDKDDKPLNSEFIQRRQKHPLYLSP